MISAIETQYMGYRMRSRLEARWGVFFDYLGIEWEYEKEGFDLGDDGYYLPDFWLPVQHVWVEIKPTVPTPFECGLCDRLAQLKYPVVMLWGNIGSEHGYMWTREVGAGECCWAYQRDIDYYFFTSVQAALDRGSLDKAYKAARSARFEHGETGGRQAG